MAKKLPAAKPAPLSAKDRRERFNRTRKATTIYFEDALDSYLQAAKLASLDPETARFAASVNGIVNEAVREYSESHPLPRGRKPVQKTKA
jgi:hypothetical protein